MFLVLRAFRFSDRVGTMAIVESEKQTIPPQPVDPEIEAMVKAGVHFGHVTSKTHPKMKIFIAGVRNTVHILNLDQTKEQLAQALHFMKELKAQGKTILFVGTKVQIQALFKEVAKEMDMPYVSERWIGGTLTNFGKIRERLDRLEELERQQREGELEKYTKKEQADFDKEVQALERRFGGLRKLHGMPDAMFICDLDVNEIAKREAIQKGIPIVAITDTDINPEGITYVIPANDDAVSSVAYILNRVKEVMINTPLPIPVVLNKEEKEQA